MQGSKSETTCLLLLLLLFFLDWSSCCCCCCVCMFGAWGDGLLDAVWAHHRCCSHSYSSNLKLLPRPAAAAERHCSSVMKCLGLLSLAESHTAASANADAADCLTTASRHKTLPYRWINSDGDLATPPHFSLKNSYLHLQINRLLGLLFKSSKLLLLHKLFRGRTGWNDA